MIKISFEVNDEPPRLVVTERMPYPLDSVWVAQTEALYVQQWWAPVGYQNTEIELTLEEGGAWRVLQRDPQGNQFSFYGILQVAEPKRKLVITLTSEIFPESTLHITQDFAAVDGGTIVASTYEFESNEALNIYLDLGGLERLRGASAKLDALLGQLNR